MPTNSSGGLGPGLRDCSVPEGVKKFARAGRRGGGSAEATGAGRAPGAPTGKASGRGPGLLSPAPSPGGLAAYHPSGEDAESGRTRPRRNPPRGGGEPQGRWPQTPRV